ncbi:DSBA-like thioredoxin domain protein [Tsuneonella dongtanensis]|uniref:DSBA-like thioredoxin domain protein n=1 Tax=Tsuneonella dongtanensis TaxID=692370 RepID=A0A1B2ADX1_9SPHN|nr:DsbA family oxidoreductase [Tsuneonella dongtanensis]ANY20344.1 DSBA-like thioredoxin domain protein [Tsuneonella dongtanensis]
MTQHVTIDIWSDVMCPWCVIGYKHLETALASLEGEIDAEIRWLPFELNPDMPPEGEESRAHIARKYGRTPEQAEAGRTMMAERAAAAGFPFDYIGEGDPPPSMLWNTFDAHKLLLWARETAGAQAQTRLKLALFAAHFQQRRKVGERDVLLDIAGEVGLDREDARAALDDPGIADAVRAEERMAWDNNVSGVPAMVIDRKFIVPGAQEPETYVNVLRKVVAKRGG